MIKGLYTAASSMLATRRELDITSNNLANSGTTGYKRSEGVRESFPEMLFYRLNGEQREKELGSLTTGVRLAGSYTDFSPGALRKTGDQLDLALRGEGYFVVQTPEGRRYTRNGNFTVDEDSRIVTQQGYPVLGTDDMPVQVQDGLKISFDGQGRIYYDELAGRSLQIVSFAEENSLSRMGGNLYEAAAGAEEIPAENYQLYQGYLEGSNVNIVHEMTEMIESNRLYQANQKVIRSLDETLDQAVNRVGRLG